MGDDHISWERLLRALNDSNLPTEIVTALLVHLAQVCPQCRDELEKAKANRWVTAFPEQARKSQPTDLPGLPGGPWEQIEALRKTAQRDLRKLLRTPEAHRAGLISRALTRFRNPLLVDLLIDECRRQITKNPFVALGWAERAQEVALRIIQKEVGESWAMTCVARANAYRGNALRVIGDLRAADPLLGFALDVFRAKGSGDPLVEAEICSLLASLRKDQRRFAEAHECLDRAHLLYLDVDDFQGAGRSLVQTSQLLAHQGDPKQAIDAADAALHILDQDRDPFLYLCAVHNRAHSLVEAGRFAECREALRCHRDLYEAEPGAFSERHYRWLDARADVGLGELESGVAGLEAIRQEFISEGLAYEAALAGFHLALAYLEQDKTAEIQQLAQEMIPVFQAQDVERETIAALLLFQEAARKECVTRSMVEEMARSLRIASQRPRCKQPS